MPSDLLVDNDVLIKLANYTLLEELARLAAGASVFSLGAARFVVGKELQRRGPASSTQSFASFMPAMTALEPTDEEVVIAASLLEEGMDRGLEVDAGEALLFAAGVSRPSTLLITGDKRAIAGAEATLAFVPELEPLRGRVVCLEQLLCRLVQDLGGVKLRGLVCAAPKADRALSACFGCSYPEIQSSHDEALRSYIEDLRRSAPNVLHPGLAVPTA